MKRLAGVVLIVVALASTPAPAQLAVFDPSNFIQNSLTAARSLQEINNQLQQLTNEATMLVNEARNLTSLPFSIVAQLRATLATTTNLIRRGEYKKLDQELETGWKKGMISWERSIDMRRRDVVMGAAYMTVCGDARRSEDARPQPLQIIQCSPLRRPDDVIGGAERQGLNRHRWVISAAGDEIAAVDDEQVRNVVRTVESVDDRRLGIVAHAAGAAVVRAAAAVVGRAGPDAFGAGGFEHFD